MFLWLSLLLVFGFGLSAGSEEAKAVFGYLPEWRHRFLDEDHRERLEAICKTVTHVILFSVEVGADGNIAALDRFPEAERLTRLKQVCSNSKVLICFGGNSRTNNFPTVVLSSQLRKAFITNVKIFLEEHGLHGVDWNWEYPKSKEEWIGLKNLIDESESLFGGEMLQTLAYYPDSQQEKIIHFLGLDKNVQYMHAMAYDQPRQHSTFEFAQRVVEQAKDAGLPMGKVTLGLPFYARHLVANEWITYHDVRKRITEDEREFVTDQFKGWSFNGPATIAKKVHLARAKGLGGLMIWESGQDSEDAELHQAIRDALSSDSTSEHSEL